MRLVLLSMTFAFTLVACESETCREKRATYACDTNFVIACDSLDSTDDPVCRCEGDYALTDDGACRVRDVDACCACLFTVDAGAPCASSSVQPCSDALESGAFIAVDDDCRTSRCGDVCWFLRSVDAGA
jgi:hypothetical protein